jgi:uncharacterized membrane-anchored protein
MIIFAHNRSTFQIALLTVLLCAGGLSSLAPSAAAQTTAAPALSDEAKQKKIAEGRKAAFEAAQKVQRLGPEKIKLRDQGTVDLPQGYVYIPQPEADGILVANGGFASAQTVGLFFPTADNQNWWARLNFLPEGYIKDDEAKDWNADELLKNLKDGTEAGNDSRIERGFPPVEVSGWVEKPAYDAATHRLIWSAVVRSKGSTSDPGSVNYNTYALGREGYFSLNLITDPSTVDKDKAGARELLAAISFAPGKAYSDFNASTDHIAEYGIAALIGGVAAKKLGLLALAAAFALKFAKVIGIAAVAFGVGLTRFFRRKKPEQ